jgi:hypothetical protein
MEDRSAFEVLLDYPKSKGLPFETHKNSRRFYVSSNDPILKTKYVLFKEGALFFFAYDSFSSKASMNQTFSGIYSISNINKGFECEISKKYWVDFVRRGRKKTGIKVIDDNLTILSNSDRIIKEFVNKRIATKLLQLESEISPLRLIVKKDYLELIDELKAKSIIGLETNRWIYEREEIESLFENGREIIEELNNPIE